MRYQISIIKKRKIFKNPPKKSQPETGFHFQVNQTKPISNYLMFEGTDTQKRDSGDANIYIYINIYVYNRERERNGI